MKVAFLGLGTMGAPMAKTSPRSFALVVWNRTAAAPSRSRPRRRHTRRGGGRKADVVVSILSDPAALKAVWSARYEGFVPGSLAIDMSTVDPAIGPRAGRSAWRGGGRFLDAPVSGTRKPAVDGKLLIMAGGDAEDVERARPVLETMGRVIHMGGVGQGMATKLVLNGLGAHMLTGFSP